MQHCDTIIASDTLRMMYSGSVITPVILPARAVGRGPRFAVSDSRFACSVVTDDITENALSASITRFGCIHNAVASI